MGSEASILLGATTAASLTATDLGYAVLALLVPWILLVVSLRRQYLVTLRESLARRDITDLDSGLYDPGEPIDLPRHPQWKR